ncbi:hypothetical protein DYB26_008466 [Aphanomyces astaci]|uniref:HECT-type E3 ubiquitin transferase n=1 Tax=Aphanomyces astaci TaxID=112090 RepID=A0A397B2U5_APHAT|nr:hypothetical protein DYB36_004075 [Aphanomyces astaci]RHY89211.1 hypothetical protein DYB31_005599 [Aphanomyces astaci]RHZ42835.1 hypothetical protein DYB26_008466 [Aphanomyces astaci]
MTTPTRSEHLWRCGICWFDSPSDKGACMLCESDRGTSFESPSDLNAVQHSAWARNQWVRTFDHVNDVAMWKQRPTHATTCADYFFVIASSNVITDDDDDACQCLTWQPLTRETSAAATLSGESLLSSWFLDDADDTGVPSVVPFQEKFATSLIHWTHTVASVTKIKVHRDTVWPESVAALVEIRAASKTKVVFLGEEGVDAGGVQREWYSLLSQAFLDNGLFIEHDNRSLGLNPLYAADPMHFVVLGRFLGRAIIDGQVLPFSLTVPLFKTLLGYPVSIEDIRYIDDTTYTSLVYVRDTADVGALALDFTWTLPDGTSVELMQGGSDVAVTEANQAEYVAALVRFWLLDAVQGPLALVVRGFYNVLSPDVMFRFDYKELELILCGTSEINIVEWQFETVATSDLTASPALGWFWDVVERDMQPHDRAKLLQFTTGSSRVPLQGFRALTGNDGQLCPFNLKGVPYTKGALPKVHTCFNRIVLPLYPSRYLMHEALFVLVNMEVKEFTMK